MRLYNIYSKLSSGKRINKAADDAAGLAKNTTFNEQTLQDGSMADMYLATNPEGSGRR